MDLGCGNGLLVYLLNSEGYSGVGLDVRKRKIWDLFRETADLRESTIIPSLDLRYSEYDWLIGNHSDELTPWIPVISALSNSNFFVLPCCPFEFKTKFNRRNTKLSAYSDYMNYISEVIEICGFKVEKDKLKIPSTKRTCFVGRHGLGYSKENIITLVNGSSDKDFKPREKVEKVRNCTQINSGIVDKIVKLIFNFLIKNINQKDLQDTKQMPIMEIKCLIK